MTDLNWVLVRQFVASCEQAGIEPPQSVVRALHVLDVAQAHVADPTGPLLGASDSEVRERVEQLSIRAHDGLGLGALRGMQPGVDAVSDALAREVASTVVPELDYVITSLQDRFNEAARPLEVAARDYGIEAGTSSDDIIDRPDFEEAGAAWRAMRSGWFKLQPLVALRITISKTFLLSPTADETRKAGYIVFSDSDINPSVLFSDAWSLDPSAYRVQGERSAHLDWLSLARHGLRMSTVTEVQQKIAARGVERVASAPSVRVTGDIDADRDELRTK